MDLNEMIRTQKEFDQRHGWTPSGELSEVIEFINKDIIGIIGELGEFSNIIKKINLEHDSKFKKEFEKTFKENESKLAEELVDTFIYLIRIASHLNIDLEKEYLSKLYYNNNKYKRFECND